MYLHNILTGIKRDKSLKLVCSCEERLKSAKELNDQKATDAENTIIDLYGGMAKSTGCAHYDCYADAPSDGNGEHNDYVDCMPEGFYPFDAEVIESYIEYDGRTGWHYDWSGNAT